MNNKSLRGGAFRPSRKSPNQESRTPAPAPKGGHRNAATRPASGGVVSKADRSDATTALSKAKAAVDLRLGLSKKPHAVTLPKYVVGDVDPISIESRSNKSDSWAICNYGMVLSRKGEWGFEPLPSSRSDLWLRQHRFTLAEAFAVCGIKQPKKRGAA